MRLLVAGGRAYDHRRSRRGTDRSGAVDFRADRTPGRGAVTRDTGRAPGSHSVCSGANLVITAWSAGPDAVHAGTGARVLDGGFRDATTASGSAGARLS